MPPAKASSAQPGASEHSVGSKDAGSPPAEASSAQAGASGCSRCAGTDAQGSARGEPGFIIASALRRGTPMSSVSTRRTNKAWIGSSLSASGGEIAEGGAWAKPAEVLKKPGQSPNGSVFRKDARLQPLHQVGPDRSLSSDPLEEHVHGADQVAQSHGMPGPEHLRILPDLGIGYGELQRGSARRIRDLRAILSPDRKTAKPGGFRR